MSLEPRKEPKVGKQHMTSHRTISLTLTFLAAASLGRRARCRIRRSAAQRLWRSRRGQPGDPRLGADRWRGRGRRLFRRFLGPDGSSASAAAGAQPGAGPTARSPARTGTGSSAGSGPRAAGRGVGTRGSGGGGIRRRCACVSGLCRGMRPPAAPGGLGALGLSGEDLGYVLLALGALALTGVLTRRLARTPVRAGRPVVAKAIGRRTRVSD